MSRRQGEVRHQRQRGVAVITALLLTTLAVTIVASLFWQQQVQVRSIENQRMQLQKQWILRGALDWARLILNESYRSNGGAVDTLQQPWAVGLAETRLDSYVENGRSDSEATDATITGKIMDAQAFLNLRGLSVNSAVNATEVKAFERLLTILRLDPALARAAAVGMAAGQVKAAPGLGSGGVGGTAASLLVGVAPVPALGVQRQTEAAQGTTGAPAAGAGAGIPAENARLMEIAQLNDLLSVPGFTPEIVTKLKNFAIILPSTTAVNVNTASAEVLAARIGTLGLDGARALVVSRDRAIFRDMADFTNRLSGQSLPPDANVGVNTGYFIVDGRVKLNRAGLEVLALIHRQAPPGIGAPPVSRVVWIQEN